MWTLLGKIFWHLLRLRYSVRIQGMSPEELSELSKKGGILFLPNHPAHMDPLFLFLWLWPRFRMRPIVIEYIYRLKILKKIMSLVKAISIPNFDTSVNQLKVKRAQEAVLSVARGLKNKENFVLYPGGRLKVGPREVLGGASAAHALVQECPEASVVLIRTSGLWGSSFSRAILGKSPDLPKTLWEGIKTILKNGIFFCPRRKVLIEIALAPANLPKKGTRVEFNRFLEHWYNRYPKEGGTWSEEEPLRQISYSFWRKKVPLIEGGKEKKNLESNKAISPEVTRKVYEEIRHILSDPGIEIAPHMNLAVDLGMDSLNIAELIAFLVRTYEIAEIRPEEIDTVQSALEMAQGARLTPHQTKKVQGHYRFPDEKGRPPPELPLGKTIPEAFLRAAQKMGSFHACGDDLVGVLSYRKLKRAVLVMAQYFRQIPEEKIAILLPASVGAYLTILAIQCARKIPVMLNWTLGPRYLDEMKKLSGFETTISSWRFLERLSHVEFGSLIEKIELLEDIKQNLSLSMKLKGALFSLFSIPLTLSCLGLSQISEEDPCTILFTSGTEALPKGVPLSHKNILSNLRSAMQCIHLDPSECLYGVLPPFHSFGFSVAGLFPLLGGMKAVYAPDPTDSFAIAEGIFRWKATMFCAAPSFLKGLFAAAKKEEIASIRLFVSGAEKAPPELYQKVADLKNGAILSEGYGATECSPIISLNRFNLPPKGVGVPLPDIEICTVHPETKQLLAHGSEGEICVRGPNVFHGYLGEAPSPFIEIEGKPWYRTGDIGYLDEENNIILSGRLKRFVKMGGEMISLTSIEAVLNEALSQRGYPLLEKALLAVCADETNPTKPEIVLFSAITLDKEEANSYLKEGGLSRLVKIGRVIHLEEIPMMGTGKVDYRKLQERLRC